MTAASQLSFVGRERELKFLQADGNQTRPAC